MNTGGSYDQCCLFIFGFLRPDLSPCSYWNWCILAALCHLIVRSPNSWQAHPPSNKVVINKLPKKVRKLFQGLLCSKLTAQVSALELFLTHQMTILSIGCKPNNFKSPKSLKLSFTNIQGLHSNFAEYESFPLTFLLLCETILDD